MLIIKASPDLNEAFSKVINQFKKDIGWSGLFLINNNSVVLYGMSYSLCFNFDTKKMFLDVVTSPVDKRLAIDATGNYHIVNTLNFILYAYGKWDMLAGLGVKQQYAQLNKTFNKALKKFDVQADLSDMGLHFTTQGLPVTYEDVLTAIVDSTIGEGIFMRGAQVELSNNSTKKVERAGSEIKRNIVSLREKEERREERATKEESVGLWRDMIWTNQNVRIKKAGLSAERGLSRELGKNFSKAAYNCTCGGSLFMAVFPPRKEMPVETQDGRLFIARVFTCNKCRFFYTPAPDKLISEGDVYRIGFDKDIKGYEDYLELLADHAYQGGNSSFNYFEEDAPLIPEETEEGSPDYPEDEQSSEGDMQSIERALTYLDAMTPAQMGELLDKMDSGFYAPLEANKFREEAERAVWQEYEKAVEELKAGDEKTAAYLETVIGEEVSIPFEEKKELIRRIKDKADDIEAFNVAGGLWDKADIKAGAAGSSAKEAVSSAPVKAVSKAKPRSKADVKEEDIEAYNVIGSLWDTDEEKAAAGARENSSSSEAARTILTKKQVLEIAKSCDQQSARFVTPLIKKIRETECEDDQFKENILKKLVTYKRGRVKKELETLIPTAERTVYNPKEYEQKSDRLKAYYELLDDDTEVKKLIDAATARNERIFDNGEKAAIGSLIKEESARDRKGVHELRKSLLTGGFRDKNLKPFIERIEGTLENADRTYVNKKYSGIEALSLEEAAEALNEAMGELILPKIKIEVIKEIKDRIFKIKSEENQLLVAKLREELASHTSAPQPLFYYDIDKMHDKEPDSDAARIIMTAKKQYMENGGEGECLRQFEYPLLVHDNSRTITGKKGFALTDSHLFTNSLAERGAYPVADIGSIYPEKAMFKERLAFENLRTGEHCIVPCSIKGEELKGLASGLNAFISYLKQKPVSRNAEYLMAAHHDTKICYRCGATYESEEKCPVCGSRDLVKL